VEWEEAVEGGGASTHVTEIRSEERLPVIGRSGEEKESRLAMPCGGWKGIFVHFYLEGEAYQAALSRGFVVTTSAKHFFGCIHKFRILDKFEDGFLCFLIYMCVCVCTRFMPCMTCAYGVVSPHALCA
jgi:hypothetical protein